ncbi:MAG TPA: GspE/PulE family protein [Candidatus Saccharimonadales bacterium]
MSVLSTENQQQVEEALVSAGLIADEDLASYKDEAAKAKEPLFQLLIKKGVLNDEQLTKTLANVTNVPYVNLSEAAIDPKVLNLVPKDIAERFMAVPLGEMNNRLVVAMLDANNVQAVDFLSNKISRPLKVYLASETGIKGILAQYHVGLDEGISAALGAEEKAADQAEDEHKSDKKKDKDIKTIVQDSPISRALTTILDYAAKSGASDIHIEPMPTDVKIRARIDGVLREIMRLPKSIEPALVSRVKILSSLKIDEHRVPQDGQFDILVAEKEVDLRIAISPVVWGEQVVIRLLDKSGVSLKLEDMGYRGRALRTIREGIKQPNGMVLTSGPTGSGKSTSMYALIQEIISDEINIVTLEDPVEYKMSGVNQIQVNSDVGLTFASGLRAILRQDPDVVLVGEIRDKETAQLAVQAALTGHLVFSTLHTNSASGVLPRLLDMGIEPFLIASTVNTVIGQRLVRRIDEGGKEEYQSNDAETKSIQETLGRLLPKTKEDAAQAAQDLGYDNLPLAGEKAYTLYKGHDSKQNPGGYKGRMGLYEVIDVNEEIENLITKRSTSGEIQKLAQAQGTVTMREDGYLKALQGLTSIAEVNRVAALDSA